MDQLFSTEDQAVTNDLQADREPKEEEEEEDSSCEDKSYSSASFNSEAELSEDTSDEKSDDEQFLYEVLKSLTIKKQKKGKAQKNTEEESYSRYPHRYPPRNDLDAIRQEPMVT